MNKNSGIIIPQVPLVEEQIDLNDAFNMLLQTNSAILQNSENALSFTAHTNRMTGNFIAMLTSLCHESIKRDPKMKDEIIKRFLFIGLIGALRAYDQYCKLPDNQKNPDAIEYINESINFFSARADERFPGLASKIRAIHVKLNSNEYKSEGFRDFDILLEMIEGDL